MYKLFDVKSVIVLRSNEKVSWYYVFRSGYYEFFYSLTGDQKVKLLDDGTLYNLEYKRESYTYTSWKWMF